MPWHEKLMKDVTNNDVLRGAVSSFDPEISECGNTLMVMHKYCIVNS